MKQFFKELRKGMLLAAVLSIALGLWMVIWPGAVKDALHFLLGGALTLFGLWEAASVFLQKKGFVTAEKIIPGVLCLAVGLMFLFHFEVFVSLIWMIVGIALLVNAIYQLQYAFELKYARVKYWFWNILTALVTLILAVLIIIKPFEAMDSMTVFAGILLLVNGLCDLAAMIWMLVYRKEIANTTTAVIVDAETASDPLLEQADEHEEG